MERRARFQSRYKRIISMPLATVENGYVTQIMRTVAIMQVTDYRDCTTCTGMETSARRL